MPSLNGLVISDDPKVWAGTGFTTVDGAGRIGSVDLIFRPDGDRRPISALCFGSDDWGSTPPADLDGIPIEIRDPSDGPDLNPNGANRIDHVVLRSPAVDRTVAALEANGFEARRRRMVESATPPIQQVFFWAGEVILELVGPLGGPGGGPPDAGGETSDSASDPGPATVWGLALTCDDLDQTTTHLAGKVSPPKTAVQPGRRISTVDAEATGITVPLALMSPHV